jgi:hypothetical protein
MSKGWLRERHVPVTLFSTMVIGHHTPPYRMNHSCNASLNWSVQMRVENANGLKLLAAILLPLMFPGLPGLPMPVLAATYYVDPVNGNNTHDGLSPSRAWKAARATGEGHTLVILGESQVPRKPSTALGPVTISTGSSPSLDAARVQRLVLGAEPLSGWVPASYSEGLWKARLETMPMAVMSVDRISGAERWFSPGCSSDYLGPEEYFWEGASRVLHVRDENPAARKFSAVIHDTATDDWKSVAVSGWSTSPPTVFQTSYDYASSPIHLLLDGAFHPETDWWHNGEGFCAGEPDTLYMRHTAGSPQAGGRRVAAVREGGGWSVTSGDFNGDGLRDAVTSNMEGQVFVYWGSPSFKGVADQVLTAPAGDSMFGFQVASAGDVNGDGFEDLLVGLDWGINKVYLLFGSRRGFPTDPADFIPPAVTVIDPPAGLPGYGFGHSISTHPGDINHDGYADVLIGVGGEESSYLCVFQGSPKGIRPTPDQVIAFPGQGSILSVSHAGDLNGDGFGDAAVSPSLLDTGALKVMAYKGSRKGIVLSGPCTLSVPAGSPEAYRSLAPAPAGDLNGDGYDDLIVGNQWAAGQYLNEGQVYVYYGSRQMGSRNPDFTIGNPLPGDNSRFGASLSGIDDFNHDGFNDFVVGCPYAPDGGFGAVYYGGIKGVSPSPNLELQTPYSLGWSLARIGNLTKSSSNYIILGEEFKTSLIYNIPLSKILVKLDIKPNNKKNILKRNDKSTIPVAILGSKAFNIKDIDIGTLTLQGLPVKTSGNNGRYIYSYKDMNRDKNMDLLVTFTNSKAWPVPEDGWAVLRGMLRDQTPLEGRDFVSVVP